MRVVTQFLEAVLVVKILVVSKLFSSGVLLPRGSVVVVVIVCCLCFCRVVCVVLVFVLKKDVCVIRRVVGVFGCGFFMRFIVMLINGSLVVCFVRRVVSCVVFFVCCVGLGSVVFRVICVVCGVGLRSVVFRVICVVFGVVFVRGVGLRGIVFGVVLVVVFLVFCDVDLAVVVLGVVVVVIFFVVVI